MVLLAAAVATGVDTGASAQERPNGTWQQLPPPNNSGLPTFVDDLTGRFWVQSEHDGAAFWTFDLRGDGGWTRVRTPGLPLFLYDWEPILFDRTNRRALVVGHPSTYQDTTGFTKGPMEVWELPLDEGRWSKLDVAGKAPSPRRGPALCTDGVGGRLFLVGGFALDGFSDEVLGDVWSLDLGATPSWHQVEVTGFQGHGFVGGEMFYEPEERRLVLLAAEDTMHIDGVDDYHRVQALNLEGSPGWITLSNPAPEEYRPYYQTAFNRLQNQLLILHSGFFNEPAESTYLWAFDGRGDGAWRIVPIADGPSGDFEDALSVDPSTNSVVLFGTRRGSEAGRRADLWLGGLDGKKPWERRYSSIASNSARVSSPSVFDPVRRRLVALGEGGFAPTALLYQVDAPHTWSEIACVGPGPSTRRDNECVVFDSAGDRLLLYGGSIDRAELGDLWELSFAVSPPRWRRILPDGEVPSPRTGASAIFDPSRRRMILFGGYAGENLDDTWELDLSAVEPRWNRIATRGGPPAGRREHTAVYDSRRNGMIVFGGATGSQVTPVPQNDAWLLSFSDCDAWVRIPLQGAATMPRFQHGAAYDRRGDRMVVLGGRDQNGQRYDCVSLDLGTPSRWTVQHPGGQIPFSDFFPSLLFDEVTDRMIQLHQFGGPINAIAYGRASTEPVDPVAGTGDFRILGVGPNPSRGDVTIAFEVPRATTVQTRLYDVRGRLVRDLGSTMYAPGPHIVCWNGKDEGGSRLRDGVYFARIVVEGKAISGKIVLMD